MTKILLIEDDPQTVLMMRTLLPVILKGKFDALLIATGVDEGRQVLEAHENEMLLILSDGNITGGTILDLAPSLKSALEKGSEMIHISGETRSDRSYIDALRALAPGKDIPHLPKPLSFAANSPFLLTIEQKLDSMRIGMRDDIRAGGGAGRLEQPGFASASYERKPERLIAQRQETRARKFF